MPDDPLQDLAGGIIDVPWIRLVEEFTATLIQYTPPHFNNIYCKVTEGREAGQRALFYDIQCPEFPDEGTTEPGARLHSAATKLVQHVTVERGSFPGVIVRLAQQPNNLAPLDRIPR